MQYIYVMEYKKGDDICKSYLYLHLSFYFLRAARSQKQTSKIEYLKKRIEYAEDDIKEWKKELKSLQSSGVFSKYTSKRGKIKDKGEDISIDLNAVLMVNNSSGAATAFLGKIDGKTYIISNLHVLGEMKNAKITTIDGKEVRLFALNNQKTPRFFLLL